MISTNLFSNNNSPIQLKMRDADITYFPSFFELSEANELVKKLKKTIKWQQDTITVFGKTHMQPRLTALYADNNKSYSYSNITMTPHLFTPELINIKEKIEKEVSCKFTTCLLNLYRNGQDSNGWHADNEKELGKYPTIASISFGAERVFHFRHKTLKNQKKKMILENGSLLIMKGETQNFWQHQLPKSQKIIEPRINLTFRIIK